MNRFFTQRRDRLLTYQAMREGRITSTRRKACPSCGVESSALDWSRSQQVCPRCGYHAPVGAYYRLSMILDPGSFQELDEKLEPANPLDFPGYREYWNSAVTRKGYSGTAILSKREPLSVTYGIGLPEFDGEGRVIAAEYEGFTLVTVYTPNSQRDLVRIDYRMAFEDAFRGYLETLREKKPVIVCGDMNVAHRPIDLKNAKSNVGNAGFSYEERGKFAELLASGFVDTFRHFYPDVEGAYSWWSYMFHARENNAGWRIDYFLADERLIPRLADSRILPEVQGSDHCPVELLLKGGEAL